MKNIIQYQIKSSIQHLLKNHLIEDIKVLILSDNIDLYQDILLDLNVNFKNIKRVSSLNFDFFIDKSLIDNSFDLVVGNPPNTRQEKIKELRLIVNKYKSYCDTGNLNIYYFEKAYNLLKKDSVLSLYTSSKYTKANYAKRFRKFILENTTILEYVDFKDSSIMMLKKSKQISSSFKYVKIQENDIKLINYMDKYEYRYLQDDLDVNLFDFLPKKVLDIKKIIENKKDKNISNNTPNYIKAICNSKVLKFYKKLLWYKDLKQLPIPKIQKPFEILVNYTFFSKEQDIKNEALLFESIIENMVYDLYFEEDMKKADCFITSRVEEIVKPFGKYDNDENKTMLVKVIYDIFKDDKTIQRGLLYSRNVEVVKIINGETKND